MKTAVNLCGALIIVFACSPRPPMEAAKIQNGDFGEGLAQWDVRSIIAAAQTEMPEPGQSRAFVRLAKPPEWKSATMLQEVNLRRLQADVPVRVAADFRIPPGGGPAVIHVECMDTDARSEEANYGQLLATNSEASAADGDWHTQVVDFVAPAATNQLRIFIWVEGNVSVDVTSVKLITRPER